jgi:S1-C subfamily serine protease
MSTLEHTRRRARGVAVSMALLAACLVSAHGAAATSVVRDTAAHGPTHRASLTDATTAAAGVVDVYSKLNNHGLAAAGTGIVVDAAGDVLTNYHVVRGARRIRVNEPSGTPHRATVLDADPAHDVALLAVRGSWGPGPATIGDSSTLAVGDFVEAVGNAGGGGGMPSLAPGMVTALNQSITATDDDGSHPEHLEGLIQTNANIQPGDSGGPLLNTAGQVVGMDTAAALGGVDLAAAPEAYAIPINAAMAFVQRVQAGHPVDSSMIKRERHRQRTRAHRARVAATRSR